MTSGQSYFHALISCIFCERKVNGSSVRQPGPLFPLWPCICRDSHVQAYCFCYWLQKSFRLILINKHRQHSARGAPRPTRR